jgi:hypothetical protein
MALVSEEREGAGEAERGALGLGERLRKRLRFWQQWRAAASVRRIYREMSALAAGYGYREARRRRRTNTSNACRAVARRAGESKLITQAYVRVRYGELPETRRSWSRCAGPGKRLRQLPPPEE